MKKIDKTDYDFEKYYQVFISSTKEDLSAVREKIELELTGTRFLPFGMESLQAFDDNIWERLKRKIDESDFVVLIIAGKYGSLVDEKTGLSYTRMEYEYAVSQKKKVLAFIKDRKALAANECDIGEKGVLLQKFIDEVRTPGRYAREWKDEAELLIRVSNGLNEQLNIMLENGETPIGWVRGKRGVTSQLKETKMDFYNLNIKITGTKDDCDNGDAIITYLGSAQVDSPKRPIVYQDRVKNVFGIKKHFFTPAEVVENEDEFERNPRMLDYRLVSGKDDDKLRFTGTIVANCQLQQIKGGIGLHIPYYAECVTVFLDISSVPFIKNYNGKPCVIRKNSDGIVQQFDETEVFYDEENLTYVITAYNVPADSNIAFNWDNRKEKNK